MNLKMNSKGIVVDYIKSLVKDLFGIDSHYDYYDEKTHWYLGEFLRDLNNKYSINLLNHYNVYSGKMIDDYRIMADNGIVDLIKTEKIDPLYDLVVIQVKPNNFSFIKWNNCSISFSNLQHRHLFLIFIGYINLLTFLYLNSRQQILNGLTA